MNSSEKPIDEPVAADQRAGALAGLWAMLGLLLVAAAILFNGTILTWVLSPWGPPLDRTLEGLPGARLRLAAGGAVLLTGAFVFRRLGLFRLAARTTLRSNLILLVTVLSFFVFGLEQLLAPRYGRKAESATSLFTRDPDLGWRLRPGAADTWGGVPARVNSLGLRGSEPPPPAEGQLRILFLGDSVTFGYKVEEGVPFPAQLGPLLGPLIPGRMVVPLNAGVGGYSPWQELLFLERHGPELAPDMVVVGFVLNDVTEKFSLVQFGGGELGFQIRHAAEGLGDRLAARSSIFAFGGYLRDRIRFGTDAARAARGMERLQVMDLLYDEKRELADEAWRMTLENLQRIFRLCKERELPALLVAFPYAFQLENPRGYGRPQRILGRFAAAQEIDMVDLLPLLRDDLTRDGLPISAYFLDDNHLSPAGHRAVARILAGEIAGRLTR